MISHPLALLLLLLLPFLASCQSEAAIHEATSGVEVAATSTADEDTGPALPKRSASLATLIDSMHLDARTIRFHVDKSDRRFHVYVSDSLLKTYPCVLGEKPVGDKICQGDRKTPEGTFTFRSKRVHNAWHKFIWVDYPNAESWRRYKERKEQGLVPAGKDIGGEIGIHGVPEGYDHWIDAGEGWTWGCIALKNADVDEIYPYIRTDKTKLMIVP